MEANRKPRRSTTGAARVNVIHNFQSLCGGPGLMNDWHRTSLAISSSLDPGLGVLDVTYAKASYKVLQRAMHIHSTSSRNFIPTMLDDLRPP